MVLQQSKQSPEGKAIRSRATDGKIYFSYAQIHVRVILWLSLF